MNDDTTDHAPERIEHRSESGRALTWRITPRTETCIGCGADTRKPRLVRSEESASDAGSMLYACPPCAARYPA